MQSGNKMRSITLISGLIILLVGIAGAQESPETPQTKKERIEAERLWEQMVKVKGGREKLHSISNMMLTKGSNPDSIQMEFYVYPNKYWEWSKGRIVHDYLDVMTVNLDVGVILFSNPVLIGSSSQEGWVTNKKLTTELERANYREGYLMNSCRFLLETKWLKPTPIRVRQEIVNKERLDVVETRFSTLRVYPDSREDYYVDPESLIVRAIAHYSKGVLIRYYLFDRYTIVNGIQVPGKYGVVYTVDDFKKASFTPLTFRFNVDYDEKLFERPPSVEAGPDAWKPKPKQN